MSSLLDSIRQYVRPDLIHRAAELFSETENGISKSLNGLVPVLLAGMLNKTADPDGMRGIYKSIRDFDPAVLDNLPDLLGSGNLAHNDPKDAAGHFLGALFGDKIPAITNAMAAFAGTRASTVSSLLGLAGPLVMGVLYKRIDSEGLNVSGLTNLLKNDKNSILSALPASVAALLTPDPGAETPGQIQRTEGVQWIWPLLLLFVLGGGIMYYLKNCSNAPEEAAASSPTVTMLPEPSENVRAAQTSPEELGLVCNPCTFEKGLIRFIEGPQPVDKTTWFNFDHLNFRTGSADIDMENSKDQLSNLYRILQHFPKVKLKVGGYTDNVGKEADNMKLSQARALAVVNAIEAMGIEKGRLDPEGYGSQHPVASNDTEEGRAQNRRIAVRVMEK